jgi:hypothetical protein
MNHYRDQVAAALRAVTILGRTRYAWLGRASRSLPPSLDAEMDDAERRGYLVACLREELYSSFYCHGAPVPARWGLPEPVSADPWLIDAMSAANHADGGWEPGWTVERLEDGDVLATTSRLRARVSVRDCLPSDGSLRPGAALSVRLPKELPAVSPGFFTVLGGDMPIHSATGIVRVYWNVGRDGAPALVSALTTQLGGQRMPFRLKVADHPSRLARCDAAILYVAADSFPRLRPALETVAAHLAPGLGRSIPALTLRMAPGVGLAEDGDASESFGARRCALLADGVVIAHEQGVVDPGAQLDAVAARLAQDGVEIDRPYLEPSLAGRHVL